MSTAWFLCQQKGWGWFLSSVFYLQSKDIGNVIWSTGVCTAADPGSLFLCSLTGQCYTGENAFPSGLIPILKVLLSIFSLHLKHFQIKLHWAYLLLTKPPFSSIHPAISFSSLLFLVWVTRGAQNNLSGDDYALTGHLLDVSISIF